MQSRSKGSARVALLVLALVAAGVLTFLHFGGDSLVEAPVAHELEQALDERASSLELGSGASLEARLDEVEAATKPTRVEAQPVASNAAPHLHVKLFVRTRGPHSSDGPVDSPLPNVNVDLVLAAPGDEYDAPPIARVQGDAEGLVELDLDWSLVEAARAKSADARIVARVHELGWQWNTAARELPRRPGAVELWLVAARGGTLLVHTTDASGRRVGAEVVVYTPPVENSPKHRYEMQRDANQFGTFAFHFESEESPEFSAEAEHVGTAVALDTFVRFTDPPQVLELVLKGPGILRGHIRDGRGGSAAGLALEVELDARVRNTNYELAGTFEFRTADAQPAYRDVVGEGRTIARAVTDQDGAFVIDGLRRDLYRIRVPGPRPLDGAVELTPTPVLADGSELALVRDRPHLVVRVLDSAGRPWTHPSWAHAASATDPESVRAPAISWPSEPRVRVAPTPRVGDTSPAPIRAGAVVGNEWVFDVESGRAHEIVLDGSNLAPIAQRVEVPAGAGRIEVDVRAAPSGIGIVDLQVLDLAGALVREAVMIRIEDPGTNIALVEVASTTNFDKFWPSAFEVPAGSWRLVVEGRERFTHFNTRGGERTFGRVETPILVRAGEREEIAVHLSLGGRLRLTLRGEPLGDSKPAEPLGDGGSSLVEAEIVKSAMIPGAAVTLLESGRAPVPVMFDESGVEKLAAVYDAPAWWRAGAPKLGQTRTSFVMPAGEYTLDVRLPDGRTATKPVVLVEGDVTDVTIEF